MGNTSKILDFFSPCNVQSVSDCSNKYMLISKSRRLHFISKLLEQTGWKFVLSDFRFVGSVTQLNYYCKGLKFPESDLGYFIHIKLSEIQYTIFLMNLEHKGRPSPWLLKNFLSTSDFREHLRIQSKEFSRQSN